MTTLQLVLLVALLVTAVATAVGLVRTIRSDGYGHRPPPPSREPWHTRGRADPLHR